MRKEEQLLAYLKGACPGRQHAAPGRRLRDILGVSESRLHEMVNHLRQEGYPIGSGRDGYFYIRTFGEARETEEHLARMIRGLEAARQGLLRGMEEKLLERLALREALRHLGEKERLVIQLRYYHSLTQQRVAELIGVSQVQVSRIEKKALERLRTFF